jgi:hypothetical protein
MHRQDYKRELCWFEPRWICQARTQREVLFMRRKRFWFVCVFIPCGLFIALMLILSQSVPEVREDFINVILRGVLAVAAVLTFLRYGTAWLPSMVSVNSRGIYTGGRLIPRDQIKSITLDAHNPSKTMMVVARHPRQKPSLRGRAKIEVIKSSSEISTIGVGKSISLDQLFTLIRGTFPEVELEKLPHEPSP